MSSGRVPWRLANSQTPGGGSVSLQRTPGHVHRPTRSRATTLPTRASRAFTTCRAGSSTAGRSLSDAPPRRQKLGGTGVVGQGGEERVPLGRRHVRGGDDGQEQGH